MRCAIYIRVSGKRQIKGVSLDDQLRACREYAARLGWVIIEVYVELGRSAFTEKLEKRVAFQQMLEDAKKKRFDVVLVYKLDRFARKTLVQYQAAAELERYKVQIASATEPIDRKTTAGRMTFGMLAVAAEAYSDQLSERMRDTRRAEARQGRHVGPVPVGYIRRADGKLEPSPHLPDREAVQFGFRLYATGNESGRTVTLKLNDAGYTWPKSDGTRMPFHKDGVIEMLQNPVYIGRITAVGVVVEDAHEPLIDRATWDAAQGIMRERATKSPAGGRTSVATFQRQEGLLIDLAYCANCGARLWYLCTPRCYYRCSGRSYGSHCNARWCRTETIEAQVLQEIGKLTLPADWRDGALVRARKLMEEQQPGYVDHAALEGKLKRLARLYQDGLIDDASYERDRDTIRAQLAAPAAMLPFDDMRAVATLLGNLAELLKEATTEERRAILVQLIDQVYLKHDAVLGIRPTLRAWPLMQTVYEQFLQSVIRWAGWGSSLDPHTLVKMAPAVLRAA
jgi:site-specific DNA recombinase